MSDDRSFMRLALRLGRRGLGRTSPNPPVGAVVVKDEQVVGKGYHIRAGAPHGEAAALRDAGEKARGATLYVTLEPCNHHGRTPPCTEAVLAAGIRRVVLGARDPNPRVEGRGVEYLRRHGVHVETGVEREACEELIAPFTKHVRTGLPLVTLKLAASLDGRIATATGSSRWITSEPARRYVHRLRNETDAVMVGVGTVIADDPLLTCRLRGGRDPLRVVVDGRLRIPLGAKVVSPALAAGTLIATTAGGRSSAVRELERRGVSVLTLPAIEGGISLRGLLRALGRRGVMSVLIEGGATLAAAALRERAVDRLLLFLAPKLIGGDGKPMIAGLGITTVGRARRLCVSRVSRLGPDLVVRATLGAS